MSFSLSLLHQTKLSLLFALMCSIKWERNCRIWGGGEKGVPGLNSFCIAQKMKIDFKLFSFVKPKIIMELSTPFLA